jgi:hypothetical protein
MYVKYRFFSKDDLPGRRCFSTLLSRCWIKKICSAAFDIEAVLPDPTNNFN